VTIKSIIYDLDGVLISTYDWHYHSLNKALGDYGYFITKDEQKQLYEGLPTIEKLKILSKQKGLDCRHYDDIVEKKQKALGTYLENNLKKDNRVINLMESLRHQGYNQILCSNTTDSTVNFVLEKMEINNYFSLVLTHKHIKHPKPNPEIYLKAIKLAKHRPRECLILEDSIHGLKAANSSGANVMIVKDVSEVNYENILCKIESLQ
jgi:HAD superfamily hydrolase (TIGR01509 family)